LSKQTAKILWK